MFQPAKNFNQTWMNMAESAVFKQAARKEAKSDSTPCWLKKASSQKSN